jgi:hypothetical protein
MTDRDVPTIVASNAKFVSRRVSQMFCLEQNSLRKVSLD